MSREAENDTHVWFGPAPLPPGPAGPGEPLPLTEANSSSRASRCAEASICRFDVTTACRYSFVQLRAFSHRQRAIIEPRQTLEADAPLEPLLDLLDVFTACGTFSGLVKVVHLEFELLCITHANPSAQRTERASGDAPQCRACNPPVRPSRPPRVPRGSWPGPCIAQAAGSGSPPSPGGGGGASLRGRGSLRGGEAAAAATAPLPGLACEPAVACVHTRARQCYSPASSRRITTSISSRGKEEDYNSLAPLHTLSSSSPLAASRPPRCTLHGHSFAHPAPSPAPVPPSSPAPPPLPSLADQLSRRSGSTRQRPRHSRNPRQRPQRPRRTALVRDRRTERSRSTRERSTS